MTTIQAIHGIDAITRIDPPEAGFSQERSDAMTFSSTRVADIEV
jgi:hypothetical protein